MPEHACRSCGSLDLRVFLSLGETPLADALVRPSALDSFEARYPLDAAFCRACALVQLLGEIPPKTLFVDNYLYFSSYSDQVLQHARDHAVGLIERRGLGSESLVVEIASNDGYLLRNFVDAGVPVLGIDPAPDQADAAAAAGVPTRREFFGADLARRLVAEGERADVIIANNVMAHVPALNDVVAGLHILIADDGLITVENPYVRDLIERREFDTIYHEHVCYYSCTAIDRLLRRHRLYLNDVEYFAELHGGTLRWHIGTRDEPSQAVLDYLAEERAAGLDRIEYYEGFAGEVEQIRTALLALLRDLRSAGNSIAAYGAAAKGSTLLNYAGIGTDLLDYVVDRNAHKQGLHMPGVHLPIRDPAVLLEGQPDYVLLLAWNFEREVLEQQREYLERGGQFIVPVPEPRVVGAPVGAARR